MMAIKTEINNFIFSLQDTSAYHLPYKPLEYDSSLYEVVSTSMNLLA